jgi:hypothetical protein
MVAESEHGHGHSHGTGARWLDMLVGTSAIFISVVSLVVSIGHGKTMERMAEQNDRMLAGNTRPLLTSIGSQIDPVTNKPLLRLMLKNGGVGPAVIDWFEVRYKGVAYGSLDKLLLACCAGALPSDGHVKGLIYSNVSQTILPARESVDFITLNGDAGRDLFVALDKARADIGLRACYCSVLDECWLTDFSASRPRPVKECHPDAGALPW